MSIRLFFYQSFAAALLLVASFSDTSAFAAYAIPITDTPEVVQPSKDAPLPLPPAPGTHAHLYRMNYWFTSSVIVLGSAANIYAIPKLIKAKNNLTDAELAGLNPEAIPRFDRWVLDQDIADPKRPDKASDYVLNFTILGGALLGLDKKIRGDALRLAMLYAETQVVTFALYDFSPFGPGWQNKLRPITYFSTYPDDVRREGNNRNSFYGGHVANTAAASFCAAKILNDHHPEFSSGLKYGIYGAALLPPLVVSYLRIRALKHFPSDNLVGLFIGAACGIGIPELHRFKRQAIKLGVIGTPVGPGLCATWRPKSGR